MKVRSTAVLKQGNSIEVEIEDHDMYAVVSMEDWNELSLGKKFTAMSQRADIFVLDYLRTHGEISEEFFMQRVNEIRSR